VPGVGLLHRHSIGGTALNGDGCSDFEYQDYIDEDKQIMVLKIWYLKDGPGGASG
jgi:hypothetical protein